MGKVVKAIVGIAVVVAIAALAPALTPAFLGTILGSTVAATALVTAVLGIAASAILSTVFPPPSAKNGAQAAATNYRQSIASSFIVYGQRRVGGLIVFFHPKKVGKQHFRYFVIACAGHRCKGVVSWMLADETVSVDGSGRVTSGKYANAAWLWFQRGTDDQAANATFVSECEGKWTTDHRGRGVAAIYAKFQMTDAVVSAGMPAITAVIEGKDDIVDPRTGAAGYTRLATPVFYDWMRLAREEGGFGAAADELPDAALLSAWTNVCAEAVALENGGTEERYCFDSVITTGAAPSEVRQTFVICCAGTFTDAGGVFMLRPGYWNPVSASLSESNLSGAITVPALGAPEEIANEVNGTFVDPASNYQAQAVPTRSVAAADIRQLDVDLPHITSSPRGQRILEIMLRRAQCEKRVTWPMNIAGLAVQAVDTVHLDTARYGLSNYAWVVDGWGMSSSFDVVLQLREENEDIYGAITHSALAAAPTLAVAEAITASRASHTVRANNVANLLWSDATSITIANCRVTMDDGRTADLPAGNIPALTSSTNYGVFRTLIDPLETALVGEDGTALTGESGGGFINEGASGTYFAVPFPASDAIADSGNLFLGWQQTSASDGTYAPAPAASPGFGGDGASPRITTGLVP